MERMIRTISFIGALMSILSCTSAQAVNQNEIRKKRFFDLRSQIPNMSLQELKKLSQVLSPQRGSRSQAPVAVPVKPAPSPKAPAARWQDSFMKYIGSFSNKPLRMSLPWTLAIIGASAIYAAYIYY